MKTNVTTCFKSLFKIIFLITQDLLNINQDKAF